MYKLKCRAWDIQEQKMIEWSNIFFSDMSPVTGYGEEVRYEDFILMLYTDLWDDYANELYDGDVVEIQNKSETTTSYISPINFTPYWGAQVNAHPAHIGLGIGKRRQLYDFCNYGIREESDCTCKLIGNIYKNPELLSQ